MTAAQIRWATPPRDETRETALQNALGIPRLVAAILVQRGYEDPEKAHKFLNPSLDHLHDPTLLPDYDKAVKEILGARERKETIFIHGDYDVDGVTSAALLSRFLKSIGCNVVTHVPHRMKEGYGIHIQAVERAHEAGAKLFLTCDCGISAHEQVKRAKELGMQVVVTDHHTVGEELPEADALVNPHRIGSRYPFPEISGAGVAFKLCEGMTRELDFPVNGYYRAFLDLAALGTVADVMPLIDENRVIAKFGLHHLKETKKVGLKALLRESEVFQRTDELRAWHIGFVLGPRLNAAGRIDDAAKALQLLLETDDHRAALIARDIEEINAARKAEQQKILDEAVEMVQADGLHERNVIVVGREDWHPGVIGIVAGRLVEQFNRPAFVASIDIETGTCKGSARTIPGFHLADAIRGHRHIFTGGGGHAMAAGFSLMADRLPELSDALNTYAATILTAEDFVITISADLQVKCDEVTHASVNALRMLEPHGCENPEPLFLARNLTFTHVLPTRKPEHMRAVLRDCDGPTVDCMAFNMGERLSAMEPGFTADVLFRPELDEWNGSPRLKWILKDFYPVDGATLL